ncbi:unnamed protein product [Staurois parvus]|uniref:Uncharacterized protein n=1 Tax=Staurois parvus TaxID=386267 RepID=A0ABN9FSM4_9NEOB|nr:unnamed protein product [Staurois parvus]
MVLMGTDGATLIISALMITIEIGWKQGRTDNSWGPCNRGSWGPCVLAQTQKSL